MSSTDNSELFDLCTCGHERGDHEGRTDWCHGGNRCDCEEFVIRTAFPDNEYIRFEDTPTERKTKVIRVINKRSGLELGIIQWYGPWRQYCLFPKHSTVWNNGCLETLKEVIAQLMNERKRPPEGAQ